MKNIKKYLIIVLVFIIGLSLILLKIKLNNYDNNRNEIESIENIKQEENVNEKKEEVEIKKVSVDIKGAVKNPGVYEIDNNKKIIDVINLAGGLNNNANTRLINLARNVSDEMVVIIYTEEEIKEAIKNNTTVIKPIDTVCKCPEIKNDGCLNITKENSGKTTKESTNKSSNESTTKKESTNSVNSTELININTATMEELTKVSGIGEGKAKAIIAYREENGEFKEIEDIKKVSGIGEALYTKIKDYITV